MAPPRQTLWQVLLAWHLVVFTGSGTAQQGAQDATDPPAQNRAEIARIVDEYLEVRLPSTEPHAWERVLDRLSLYGDLRLRQESDFHRDGKQDRNRQRVRARLGANYGLTDEILLGFRIVTGNRKDPNSTHVTLGDGLDKFEINMDRAFASYRPDAVEGLEVAGGKFAHPFAVNPVYGELVWDADVQPEGARASYSTTAGPVGLNLHAGQYVLIEQDLDDNAYASVAQLEARFRHSPELTSGAAVGYYYYTDVTPDGSRILLDENSGNALEDRNSDGIPDHFVSDFHILNTVMSVRYDGWAMPAQAAVEYIYNPGARDGRDQGWAAGLALGSTAEKGDWRLYYQWQVVEQDAVFSPFSQDDFLLQTNFRGHIFGVNYQLQRKIGLHLWGLISARDHRGTTPTTNSDRNQWRLRADLNIKF